jgi:hypothetical protein
VGVRVSRETPLSSMQSPNLCLRCRTISASLMSASAGSRARKSGRSRASAGGSYKIVLSPPLPAPPPTAPATFMLPSQAMYGGLHFGSADVSADGVQINNAATTWKLTMT